MKVISKPLGSGKTTSIKQYISTTKERCLVVVNDIQSQQTFRGIATICNHEENKFSRAILTKDNIVITKAKFNNILILNKKQLSLFKYIFIDESSGLNPIIMENLSSSIEHLVNLLHVTMSKKETYFSKHMALLTKIKYIKDEILNLEFSMFYKYPISETTSEMAKGLLEDLLIDYNKTHAITSTQVVELMYFISAISVNELYMGERIINDKRHIDVLYVNTSLKTFLQETKSEVYVYDATAEISSSLYEYLNIPIEEYPKLTYSNLKFHIHKYSYLTPSSGRKSIDNTLKVLQEIKEENRSNELTFCIKSRQETLAGFGFELTDYIFSGRDIGSNEYRDLTSMNIVYSNTLPMHYRCLYNKIIRNIPIEECSSPLELKKAESIIMGDRLAQLIGRLKIRQDHNAEVNIHFYCVDRGQIEVAKEHFQIPDENIILYPTKDIGIPQKSITIEDVLHCLQNEMQFAWSGRRINVAETIREGLYHPNTSKNTIASWYKRDNRDKIVDLATKNKCHIEAKSGRGGGFFIVFD